MQVVLPEGAIPARSMLKPMEHPDVRFERTVKLAWLIDADKKTVHVYRAGQSEPDVHKGVKKLAGEGPVAGFELELADIWAGV